MRSSAHEEQRLSVPMRMLDCREGQEKQRAGADFLSVASSSAERSSPRKGLDARVAQRLSILSKLTGMLGGPINQERRALVSVALASWFQQR